MTSVSLPGTRPALGGGGAPLLAAGALGLLVVAAAATRLGPTTTLAALLAAVGVVYLLAHAEWAVGVAVGVFVGAEADKSWGAPVLAKLHMPTAVQLSPFEMLMLLAVASVILHCSRRHVGFRGMAPFGLALYLAAFAITFGVVHGVLGGDYVFYIVTSTLQTVAPLFVMPFLIVNVVRTRTHLRRVLIAVPIIALLKAIAGLTVSLGGLGAVSEGVGILTYYAPTSNYVLMLFLLGMLAMLVRGVPTYTLAKWAVPVVVVCLTLSYRRTFWLATIACVLILVVIGSGKELRRFLPVLAIVVLGTGYAILTGGVLSSDSAVVQRAQSISPEKVTRNEQDRYRISERKNVLLALEKQPLTGLGVGVEWKTRYPMPFEGNDLHAYAHVGILWWWMRAGLLGGIAYLAVLGTTAWVGIRLARRHPDPLIAAASLAAGVSVFGYLIVELASAVLGADQRGTAALGVVIGLLAVAWRDLRTSTTAVGSPA